LNLGGGSWETSWCLEDNNGVAEVEAGNLQHQKSGENLQKEKQLPD